MSVPSPVGAKAITRTMETLFDTRGQNADDALVPLRMVHRQAAGQCLAAAFQLFTQGQRFRLHPLLYLFARLVQRVQLIGQHPRFAGVVAQQQRHADGHIVQPARGVQARTEREAEIACRQLLRVAVGDLQQRLNARTAFTRPDAAQPLPGQNTVVGIQRYDVRHGAERHQIEEVSQIRRRNAALLKPAFITQKSAQRQHQIKGHAHPGQRFRRKLTVAQVRVNNRFRRGQRIPRQVVIGHQHRNTQRMGRDRRQRAKKCRYPRS